MDQDRRRLNVAVKSKVLSPLLRYILRKRGLIDDLNQVIALTECEGQELSDKEYMNLLNRNLYHFLKDCGFHKVNNRYDDPVFPASVAVHSNSFSEEERTAIKRFFIHQA